jgi:hypothetical protein
MKPTLRAYPAERKLKAKKISSLNAQYTQIGEQHEKVYRETTCICIVRGYQLSSTYFVKGLALALVNCLFIAKAKGYCRR